MARNIVAFGLLVLCVSVLSVNALPKRMESELEVVEVEDFSKIDDILELIRKHLKLIKACIKDAKKQCREAGEENRVEGLRCIIRHIVTQQGLCKHPERPPKTTGAPSPTTTGEPETTEGLSSSTVPAETTVVV